MIKMGNWKIGIFDKIMINKLMGKSFIKQGVYFLEI